MATTTITLTVDNALLPSVVTAYTTTFGYNATLPDGTANPETPGQFTARMIRASVARFVRNFNDQQAANAAIAGGSTVTIT